MPRRRATAALALLCTATAHTAGGAAAAALAADGGLSPEAAAVARLAAEARAAWADAPPGPARAPAAAAGGAELRCAAGRVRPQDEPRAGREALGGGFFRLLPNASVLAAVAALPDNGAVALSNPDEAAGENLWLIRALNDSLKPTNLVTIDIVALPDNVTRSSLLRNAHLLGVLGYDCVLDQSLESAQASAAYDFLHTTHSFKFVVVAPAPRPPRPSRLDVLFLWTRPFSPAVWGLLISIGLAAAALMTWFERDTTHLARSLEECGHHAEVASARRWGRARRLGALAAHGTYLAVSTYTTNNAEGFRAATLPGRVLRSFFAFVTLLTISTYVANLAAILSFNPPARADIRQIRDFEATESSACVLNNSDSLRFMRSFFPAVKLDVIESSLYVSDLFRAVLGSGAACRGAVAPDVRVRYALGPEGDPSGDFCALQVSGDGDGDGFVSVPLSRSAVPPARGAALNRLAAALAAADAAGAAARERLNFPVDRPRCAARLAAARDDRSPGALQAYDYAGVCVLFAAGVALSLAAKALQARPSGRRRRRRDPHPQPQPSPQAPDGGKGGDWPGGHAGAPTGGGGGGGESAAAGVAVAVVSEDAAAAAAYGVSDAGIELRAGV